VKLCLILKCRTEMCKAAVYQGTCTGGGRQILPHRFFMRKYSDTTVYIR